jgi:polysaccharide export outer membrane protein
MGGGGQNYAPYTVDNNGEIDFPVLGPIRIQGFTRNEVEKFIKNELMRNSLCKDPIVTVTFYNMNFAVLGNTGTGLKQINKDRITLLEAIAMASDLNIDGIRKNVLVMRQEGDQEIPYRVDLTSAESVYGSPVYYIRQNDVIYVEPNNKAKRGSTVMGSSTYTPGFWLSMITSLISTGLLIWNLVK